MDDEKILEKAKYGRSIRKWILKDIIDKIKYAVFGVLFPSEDNEKSKTTDEQPDTTDMSKLESEESAAQKREHEEKGLKILTRKENMKKKDLKY